MRHSTGRVLCKAAAAAVVSLVLVAVASPLWAISGSSTADGGDIPHGVGDFRVDWVVYEIYPSVWVYVYDLYMVDDGDPAPDFVPGTFGITSRAGLLEAFNGDTYNFSEEAFDPGDPEIDYHWEDPVADDVRGHPGLMWEHIKALAFDNHDDTNALTALDDEHISANELASFDLSEALIGEFVVVSVNGPTAGEFDISGSPDEVHGRVPVPSPELPPVLLLTATAPLAGLRSLRRRIGRKK